MSGNKTVFQDAIKKGHNAAWDGHWAKAIAEYGRAVGEFPQDVTAHLSLAHALEESGQLESALHECRIATKLQPHDPLVMLRVAKLQEKLSHLGEATGTYMAIAELYSAHKAMGKAVEAWQKAAALEPDRTDVHQHLAEVYEAAGHDSMAAKEHLALARLHQKRGDQAKAQSAIARASQLDPQNANAKALDGELRRKDSRNPATPSPVEKAEKVALSRLAETLLEDKSSWDKVHGRPEDGQKDGAAMLSDIQVDTLTAKAVNAQSQHRVADAIEAYSKLVAAGVTRPEVRFNLGLLYFETMRYEDAIRYLRDMVDDPNYAMASHFALGQCYRAQGNVDAAVEHFLLVTKIVDLGNVRREQADELIAVYEGLAESYAAKGDKAQAESFSRALEEFLTSKGWEDKVREVRNHLELLREEGGQVSLAEVINIPESDKVLESLALSQEYLRRGKYRASSEECYRAIELAPNYLPAHVRLAEVLTKQGRLAEARTKYRTLAELAIAWGELGRAEGFYRHLLKISRDDVGERSKLIDLLMKQGRIDAALEEYVELGNGYSRARQYENAGAKFAEGLKLAAASGVNGSGAMSLRHHLAEVMAMQGDLKGALATFQEIRMLRPDDERAQMYVVDLEFHLGQSAAALKDLEDLISRYYAKNEAQKAIEVLEGLIQSYPKETTPRAWLAQMYINVGKQDKAIAVLDDLGESQLNSGQREAAAATIRQIIAMNPPRVEEYKQLLSQIVG
jgi:tetratricopeptide (TPR) repeat protein